MTNRLVMRKDVLINMETISIETIVLPQEIVDFLDYELSVYKDVEVVSNWISHAIDYDEENGTKVFGSLINLINRRDYFIAALTGYYEAEKYDINKEVFDFIDSFISNDVDNKAKLLSEWELISSEYDHFNDTHIYQWICNNRLDFFETVINLEVDDE